MQEIQEALWSWGSLSLRRTLLKAGHWSLQGNWSLRKVPKEELRWKKQCRNTLLALGTPVTGNRVPELQPLTWAEIDPADGHPVATTREGQFKARKGASDGG